MGKPLHSPQHQLLLALLRKVRTDRAVTQGKLSLRIGMQQSDISKEGRGVRRLDVLELRAWLSGLDIPLSTFVDELEVELGSHDMLVRQASGKRKS